MTTDPKQDQDQEQEQLLEIYKLHAELADRVSQRREGANRLHVSLLLGLMVFLAALMRYGADEVSAEIVLRAVAAIGALLSLTWYAVIRSYRQLNTGKFKTLRELEKELGYAFFTREWEMLAKGRSRKRYWKLTAVETSLPWIFLVLFLILMIFSFLQ